MHDSALARHVLVEGVVQGVGYRQFTRRRAARLDVSGWVRNRSDGSVEAVVRGRPTDVEAILAAMRKGPPGAEVTDLRITALDAGDIEETGFVVRPTV